MRSDPPFELTGQPRPATELARRPARPTQVARPIMCRPALAIRAGEQFSVIVEAVNPVGQDASIRCLDRVGRYWSFECLVRMPVQIGDLGSVRCTGYYRTLAPHWKFVREGESDGSNPLGV